jgi:hypothetical protein
METQYAFVRPLFCRDCCCFSGNRNFPIGSADRLEPARGRKFDQLRLPKMRKNSHPSSIGDFEFGFIADSAGWLSIACSGTDGFHQQTAIERRCLECIGIAQRTTI